MNNIEKFCEDEKVSEKVGLMKYRTCFSSICNSGYSIGLIKSGLQKYLRRREVEKMKWCGKEMYMFKFGWEDENEKKIGGGIYPC